MKTLSYVRLLCLCWCALSGQIGYGQFLYWIDGDFAAPKLGKSDLAGSNQSTASLTASSLPQGLAIDAINNKLYFGELAYTSAKVRSASPNLTGITSIDTGGSVIRGITVDGVAGKIYWTTSNLVTGGKIFKANLDGTGKQTLYSFSPGSGVNLRGIVVSGTALYWADYNARKIILGDILGAAQSDLITGLGAVVGVALGGDGNIYWTEADSNKIKRRTLVAGTIQTLVSGLSTPNYLAIDPSSAKMFWTELGVPKIKKADMTGANVQVLPITVVQPNGIAATSSPLPVQLASFTGTVVNGTSVRLNWTTVSETNNYGFYVDRKLATEQNFETLVNSFVAGHGTTLEPHQYSFVDNTAPGSTLQYRLKQVDLDGTNHFTEPITIDLLTEVKDQLPAKFDLMQNYPNPFNPSTEIKFSVEVNDAARLDVYNSLGQKVAALFNGMAERGKYYTVRFNADNLSSGVYFYRLESGSRKEIRKLMVMK